MMRSNQAALWTGQTLAAVGDRLRFFPSQSSAVLALPRGGVPVAAEVRVHSHPFDVLVVRKSVCRSRGIRDGCIAAAVLVLDHRWCAACHSLMRSSGDSTRDA